MKTVAITVERNYRIDNSDQYMKARLSHTVEPEFNESMEDCTILAIKMLNDVFRQAYPHVEEHLNFYVERQVSERIPRATLTDVPYGRQPDYVEYGGTLQEEIQSSKDLKTLESYKLLVKNNPTLLQVYNEKLSQLS